MKKYQEVIARSILDVSLTFTDHQSCKTPAEFPEGILCVSLSGFPLHRIFWQIKYCQFNIKQRSGRSAYSTAELYQRHESDIRIIVVD